MSAADGAPSPEDARVEALRSKFPWLTAGATLAADPDFVEAASPVRRRCGGCGGTTHDRRNCPMGQRVPRRCAWCRAIGHTARMCPQRPVDVPPDTASMRARANMCRRCRQVGHAMSECPQRPDGTKHCRYCHEPHHQVTTCARYRADHPEAPPFKRGPVVRHCGRCGEAGHHAPTCPTGGGDTDLVDLVPAPVVADVDSPITTASIAAGLAPIGQPEKIAPARRRCSICRQPGHRIERCPQRTGESLHKAGMPLAWRPEPVRPRPTLVDRDPEADLTDLVPDAPPTCTETAVLVQAPSAETCSRCRETGHSARGCPLRTRAAYVATPGFRHHTESQQEMRRALSRSANDVDGDDDESDLPLRPRTRGDCQDAPRPCPWVSCRHHLYLDVTSNGTLTKNFPELEPDQMRESCSLDVADRGEHVLMAVGEMLRLTRERVRQIETTALEKAKEAVDEMGELEDAPEVRHSPLGAAMG